MILHKKVWNSFSYKTFHDYMEIYLLADCLLLCDVFENFRSNCLQQYSINPCYYFSAPHFTFNAFLRHSSLTLELLSDMVSKWYALTFLNMWKGIILPSHQVLFYI